MNPSLVDRSTRFAPAAPLQTLPYDSLGMDAESLKRGILLLADYADYAAYVACQERVAATYRDEAAWTILNVANMAKFSSDRTIRQYADEIWRVSPERVE